MRQYALLLLLCTAFLSSQGQHKPRNSVGVSIGWQNFSFLDQHSSPLKYSTNSLFPKVGLFYSKQTDRSFLNVHLAASKGSVFPSRFGQRSYKSVWSPTDSFQFTVASPFVHVDMEASYLRQVSKTPDRVSTWIGASFNEAAYYGDDVARFPWLLNVADLSPRVRVQYAPLSRHSFTLQVDLSVLAAITRPVYALFPKSNRDKNVPAYLKQGTQLASMNKFQKVNFSVGYNFQASRHFAAGVQYRLKWLHYTLPKDIRAVDKQFDVRLSYTY